MEFCVLFAESTLFVYGNELDCDLRSLVFIVMTEMIHCVSNRQSPKSLYYEDSCLDKNLVSQHSF